MPALVRCAGGGTSTGDASPCFIRAKIGSNFIQQGRAVARALLPYISVAAAAGDPAALDCIRAAEEVAGGLVELGQKRRARQLAVLKYSGIRS